MAEARSAEPASAAEAEASSVAEKRRSVEAELRLVLDQAPMSFARCDAEGRLTFVNRAYAARFGMTPEAVMGKRIPEIVGVEAFATFSRYVDEATAGNRVEFEVSVPYATGTRVMHCTYLPEPAPAGERTGFVAMIEDTTDKRRDAEQVQKAAEANAKFRAMFEQGSQFAGILSLDGVVMEANRLCVDGCGFRRDEIIGRPYWECGWWSRSPQLMEMVRTASQAAAAGRRFRTETPYFVADGTERFVDLSILPVMDESGKVLFVAPTGTDITDRKRAEGDLRDANRRKDDFLATLAHELRNPLAPIRTGLEVMKRSAPDSPDATRARDMMERQLAHMVRLVDDLLDLSRIASGKMELRMQRLELRTAVDAALETAAPAVSDGGHELRVELPAKPVWIDADLTRLAQAVSNILTNAAKYTPDGGRIRVTGRADGRSAFICVEDTGMGIPRNMLRAVFDMFAQVNHGDSGRSQGGLGVGLALVKLLVEMHGGSVQAESEGLGRGSAFTVRLPLAGAPDGCAFAGATARGPSAGRRILIVDDNIDGAEMLATVLGLSGHQTRVAFDGPAALTEARDFVPELVFLDIGLPGMDGHEVAKRIRADPELAAAVLVALTGWGSAEDKRRTREAGFDFHLTKPVETKVLTDVIARSFDGPRGTALHA